MQSTSIAPVKLPKLPDTPLVSVIVGNYNYGRFLTDMVQSVLNQTYTDWELIICDDGSTDDSLEVLESLRTLDPRIRVLHQENAGQASALNNAFGESRGEIIALLDPDDWFTDDKLELVVNAFRANPNGGFVHHRCQTTNAAGDPFGPPFPDTLQSGWLFPRALNQGGYAFTAKTSEIAVRREIAEVAFPIPVELRYGYGDGHISRIATFLTEIIAIPESLSWYRLHGANFCGGAVVDRMDADSLEKWAEAYLIHFRNIYEFVRERFGDEIARQLRIVDLRDAWDLLGRLYVLRGHPEDGVLGISEAELTGTLRNSRKWHLWKLVLAMPYPLSRWILSIGVSAIDSGRGFVTRITEKTSWDGANHASRADPSAVRDVDGASDASNRSDF